MEADKLRAELLKEIEQRQKLTAELTTYREAEGSRQANWKKEFLASQEYADMTTDRTINMLDAAYSGAIRHFKEAGYPPEGANADFLDLQRLLDELPDELLGD